VGHPAERICSLFVRGMLLARAPGCEPGGEQ